MKKRTEVWVKTELWSLKTVAETLITINSWAGLVEPREEVIFESERTLCRTNAGDNGDKSQFNALVSAF
jgi:hypothetical protein